MEKDVASVVPRERAGALTARPAGATRQPRRSSPMAYDRAMRIGGLIVALGLMLVLWAVGGYYTLTWLAARGLRVASAGVVPVNALLNLGGSGDQPAYHWLVAAAAWLIPLGLSAVEIGLWPQRVQHPLTWGLWFTVLSCDALTTAAGVALVIPGDRVTAGLVGIIIGAALALFPEKAARVLWTLLREG